MSLSDPGDRLGVEGRESLLSLQGASPQGLSRAGPDFSGQSPKGIRCLGVSLAAELPPSRGYLACKSHSCLVFVALSI